VTPGVVAVRPIERAVLQEVERLRNHLWCIHDEGVTARHDQQVAHPVHSRTRDAHLPVVRAAEE
jgi:hypothetical protein